MPTAGTSVMSADDETTTFRQQLAQLRQENDALKEALEEVRVLTLITGKLRRLSADMLTTLCGHPPDV